MFETLRRSLGLLAVQFAFRGAPREIIAFTSALRSAKRTLLIMPFGQEEFLPMVAVIEVMKKKCGDRNITVVTGTRGLEVQRALPRSTFIRILSSDINALYLPHKSILRQITQASYDVAIDLNLDLVLPSAYICRASAAKVRVGFVRNRADMFYNFQVKPDPTLSRKLIYDRLATCLEMF